MASVIKELLEQTASDDVRDSLLESVLERSSLIYWTIDNHAVVQVARGSALRELGPSEQELVGQSVFEAYLEYPALLEFFRESLRGRESQGIIQLRKATFEAWHRPLRDDAGQVVGGVGVLLVMSKIAKTRNAGKNNTHSFEVLRKLANVGVFLCNEQGEIHFANEYFWSCFSLIGTGNPSGQPVGGSLQSGVFWQDLFRDENNQPLENSGQRLANQGVFRRELKLVHPNNSMEWGLVQLIAMEPGEWVGTLLDITKSKQTENLFGLERRELEKAVQARTTELMERNSQLVFEVEKRKQYAEDLQLSRNYLEAIIRNALDVILHLDRDGRILFFNRSITGYDTNKVIGTTLYDWVLPGHEGSIRTALQKVLMNEEQVSLELPVVLVTGQQALYSSRWGPIYNQGEIIGATIVARDVTHERELEKDAKKRLEEFSHLTRLGMLGEMAATISHELKQPLLAIGNYATGCLHRLDNESIDEEQVHEVLQLIAELSLRARQIVHRTREFAVKNQITPVRVRPQDLLLKSLELVQTEITRKDIVLNNELDDAVPMICIDFIQGQQVLVNLLLNAIEAIEKSDKKIQHAITIRSAVLENDSVQLTIRDTADGIVDDSIASPFDMFNTSNHSGLGMGLAVSRKIIERHGGKLQVLRSDSQGTEFEIILPNCLDSQCESLMDPFSQTEPES